MTQTPCKNAWRGVVDPAQRVPQPLQDGPFALWCLLHRLQISSSLILREL